VTIVGSYFDSFNHLLRLLTMLYLTLPYITFKRRHFTA